MSEFLDLLETVKAEEATIHRLFNSADGRGVRGMRRNDPRYARALSEAAHLVADVTSGRAPMHRLQEAMSTSDFPLLFGDIIDRSMLGKYQEWPSIWQRVARRGTVRDFRTKRQFVLDGAEGILDAVKAGEEYPETDVTEGKYDYSVSKYGRRIPFLWEAFINDDLDALRDMPERLAKAARMSEERFFTELIADSTGPDATFFASGNSNRVTSGGAGLDATKLEAGYKLIRKQRDADGNPIFTGRVRLMVPPDLEVTALTLINASQVVTAPGATSGQQVISENWMAPRFEVVVNPWLPIVDTTSGATAWYLFAEPTVGRPAVEIGFLRGHETPQIFLKSPDAVRIGGGTVGAEEGSFDTDGIDYKIRHVFGGGLLDPKAAVAYVGA